MKMFNKKGIGIQWYILLISFFISIGILFSQSAGVSIPRIGEFSMGISKSIEKGNYMPAIIERLLKEVNKNSNASFDEHKVFKLKSFCESDSYKGSLNKGTTAVGDDLNFIDAEGLLGAPNKRSCFVGEDELMIYYGENFEKEYEGFKAKEFNDINLRFSNINYKSSVEKGYDEYLNIVKTDDNFQFPINIKKDKKEKNIGEFYMSPSFKIPFHYPFDDLEKEVCILSRDCGATCDEVIAKYTGTEFRKKDYACNEYFFCTDAFEDDFEKSYPCGNEYFCMESDSRDIDGLHDGVCPDCHCLEDWHFAEACNPAGVEQVSTQIRTCKHEDVCHDSLKSREALRCCGSSYEACECPGPARAWDENCCTEKDFCDCAGASQCGVCGNPDCPVEEEPPLQTIVGDGESTVPDTGNGQGGGAVGGDAGGGDASGGDGGSSGSGGGGSGGEWEAPPSDPDDPW